MSKRALSPHAVVGPAPSLPETLEILERAVHYRDWIFSMAEPWLGRRVLEIGAGIGTLTECVADRDLVVALELEPRYIARLSRRFASTPTVEILLGSATDRRLMLSAAASRIDSAMSFNVLEHITDDVAVLRNIHDALPPDGRFVCFVPAFPGIYGTMDEALGHVRRYRRRELEGKMRSAGFSIVQSRYVGLPGYFLWFMNGRVLRSRSVTGGARSVQLYDRFVIPAVRAMESRCRAPLGQSLLVVAERD